MLSYSFLVFDGLEYFFVEFNYNFGRIEWVLI